MNKKKLIKLRCKAWGITEDEYYCNQCSDFSLEDMARAYRRGKNKGRADLEKQIAELKAQIEKMKCCGNCANLCGCGLRGYEECKNFDKWEIKEK